MTALFENPIPIYAVSAVLITLCILIFFNRRDLPSIIGMITIVLLAISMVMLERWVVTDREQVENAVVDIMLAIEANDVPGVLDFVDPEDAQLRSDVETMLPMVNVRDTSVTSLEVELAEGSEPLTAQARFRGKVDLQKREWRYVYFDRVDLDWVKHGDRWHLQGYTPYNRGKPVDARRSIQSQQFVPAGGKN